jgi:hypothetical protein
MLNVNIVKVTVFTKVKAEQFKCTDERSSARGGGLMFDDKGG